MMKKELFIGIPVVNRFDLLKKVLKGCTHWNAEILIINNSCNNSLTRAMESFANTNGCEIISNKQNIGVAASWNLIIKEGLQRGYEQIVISSDDTLIEDSSIKYIEKIKFSQNDVIWHLNVWNLFIIHRSAIDKVGWFDENYYPAYYEDVDYSYRCDKICSDAERVIVVNSPAELHTFDYGYKKMKYEVMPGLTTLHLGSQSRKKNLFFKAYVYLHLKINHFYYVRKWGGPMYREKYTRPFDNNKSYDTTIPKNLVEKIMYFRTDIFSSIISRILR